MPVPNKIMACVCMSFIPLRWILVKPAHLDDSRELRAVFFNGRRQFASVWQAETAFRAAKAFVMPWARTMTMIAQRQENVI